MSRLVVKKHRPLEILLAVSILSITFSVIVWLMLDTVHWDFIKDKLSDSEKSLLLWEVNQELEKENDVLKEKVTMLERSTQIDNQTAQKLHNEILGLQDQVYRLKGELEFYKGIMASTTDSKGLNVQGLHIEATEKQDIYRFKLVLTNVAKSDKVIEATLDMSIEGMNQEGTMVLALKEVITSQGFNQDIKFKNFQRIEGNLAFPTGFKPLRVIVGLQQKGLKTTVERIFDWPATAG